MHEQLLRDWNAYAAPGDRERGTPDLAGWTIRSVEHDGDPAFAAAYAALHAEFAAAGELEPRPVLQARLQGPRITPAGLVLHYRLHVVTDAAGQLAAVRDHTVIVPRDPEHESIVHLSHALVLPAARGHGLGALLRTAPMLDAQLVRPVPHRATLVAEMEHPDLSDNLPDDQRNARQHRLAVYERAGFAMIDPYTVAYAQPCFTDLPDHPPVPLRLIIRRAQREAMRTIPARQARKLVAALYAMYARDLPPAAMTRVHVRLERMPDTDRALALLPPTLAL